MAYTSVPIRKDLDGKPIPQYYNPISDQYEPVNGLGGVQKVVLCDANGIVDMDTISNQLNDLFTEISLKLDELIEVVK